MPRNKITPAKGLSVPFPDGARYLDPEGEKLSVTPYWLRRERDGDVTIARPAPRKPPKPSKPASKGDK